MEEQFEKLTFYQQLLLEMMDTKNYPFYYLVISKGITRQEMNDIFDLCNELNEKYKEQREQGFINFTPLLIQFVGMLPYVLDVKQTINALKKQRLFEELMDVLLDSINEIDK